MVVGSLCLLSAAMTAVLTAQINDSYPYVLWPWVSSLQIALVHLVVVQESMLVLMSACNEASARQQGRRQVIFTVRAAQAWVTPPPTPVTPGRQRVPPV